MGEGRMIELIKKYLLKLVDDIDAGNSNISDSEAIELVDTLKRLTDNMRRFDDFYINRHNSESDFIDMVKNMNHEEKKKLVEMIEGGEGSEHFNDSYAKYTVSKMFHTEGGRKYVGEKFDMLKAKEICERYRGIIPQSATHGDVYVAINAQYHDYCELFKAWFEDSVDSKIIESAINFWFKDDDFKSGCKVWKYFNMM